MYRHAAPEDLDEVAPLEAAEARASLAWVYIYRHGPISRAQLAQELRIDESEVAPILERLLADGRIQVECEDGGPRYRADACIIPLGSRAGWEAAVVDHYRALVRALIAKLQAGARGSSARDEIGGSTFTFDLWPGHPGEAHTRGLLARVRGDVAALWDEVDAHNTQTPAPADGAYTVTFYCGQYLESDPLEEDS